MRRGLASLITGLSLLVATASWAGFTLSRTILDPGRSERLAQQLLDNEQVRDALVDRLADAIEPQIPPEVPVSRGLIESGAEFALDDPEVQAVIRDGMVRYHRNALEGNTEPVVIETGALGAASRRSLVGIRPELDPFLPASPSVQVELPTTGFTWLSATKRFVDRYTLLGAVVALAGATVALAVARERGAVLRRVAFWGYGAAAFWLVVGFAIPRVADVVSPTSGAIASAAVDVFFGAMIRPAVALAVASTAVLLLGFAIPMFGQRRGARVLQPARAGGGAGTGPGPGAIVPTPAAPSGAGPAARPLVASPPLVRPAERLSPTERRPAPAAWGPISTSSAPTSTPVVGPNGQAGSRRDPTTEMPRPTTEADAAAVEDRSTDPRRAELDPVEPTPAWEEGIGYLDDERGPTTRFEPR